ncbi:hypothetical protein M3204_22900 [Mesobacillus subterraneus]|uniref:hypothetical protein n=1 Tax=Mesobacillus subterraneus TaxID=285983 RepID=UPI00203E0DBE|nr:hypothetical protein [Mesobacillus subterraneus]MCM3667250.1 hypothetical protein [Mesobacillus subterraneus]MCM3686183.1 hypothetical protein [Mesobacillus subterraneus]
MVKIRLPNGITGFHNSTNNLPPKVDGRQFKSVCAAIVNRSGGKLLKFREPLYPLNFYEAEVKVNDNEFYILLNEHYPYIAFASVVEFGKIDFINASELLTQFSPFYKVLSLKELNEPLNIKSDSINLNSAELEQISYWKPKTIGEVIFNFWD